MPAFIDISGNTYNRLTVISRAPNNKYKQTMWNCLCQCGNMAVIAGPKLKSNHTQSCGCFQIERSHEANIKHGHSSYPNGGNSIKEYNTWGLMLKRCRNPNSVDYYLYGGRGISVCDRWLTYQNFLNDMGKAPTKSHSIDRIDSNGNYCPDNCKWSTPKEQRRNQRRIKLIEYMGKSLTPMEWSEVTGVTHKNIYARMKRGWSVEKTLTTPQS